MASGPSRVRVRVFWWGGATGRLVLVRTIDRWDVGACEIWWSAPVSQAEVASTDFLLHPGQWQQLMAGAPIDRFDLPIPLYRLSADDDPDDQTAIGEALERPDFHLLSTTHTLTENSVVLGADRPVVGTHELSELFRATPGSEPEIFARLSAEAPAPRAEYDVALSDVRGVMIGDDNVQINRFDITVRDADFDLDSVLARENVRKAIAEATMDPGDETRRRALIDALAQPGWFVSWNPARLTVTDPGRMASRGFLSSLLGFNIGVMVGDGNRQTNRFTYVTSSLPAAQDLLAGNRELAGAVAGLLVRESVTDDASTLLDVVNDAVRDLPVDFANGRLQGVDLIPYEFMSLTRVDGAMVGEGNLQQLAVTTDADFTYDSFRPYVDWGHDDLPSVDEPIRDTETAPDIEPPESWHTTSWPFSRSTPPPDPGEDPHFRGPSLY